MSANGARVAIAVGVIVLVAALGPARAGADAPCSWTKHTKRVTKKVKRNGKPRTVKRTRHWWTCEPIVPAAPVSQTPTSPAPPPPAVEEEPQPELQRLGVKAEDGGLPWSYTLSRDGLDPGEVIVELQNQGEDPHDLNLLADGEDPESTLRVPITSPGQQTAKRFTLAAGTYRLWCDLPEHDEKGMHATLVVGG